MSPDRAALSVLAADGSKTLTITLNITDTGAEVRPDSGSLIAAVRSLTWCCWADSVKALLSFICLMRAALLSRINDQLPGGAVLLSFNLKMSNECELNYLLLFSFLFYPLLNRQKHRPMMLNASNSTPTKDRYECKCRKQPVSISANSKLKYPSTHMDMENMAQLRPSHNVEEGKKNTIII